MNFIYMSNKIYLDNNSNEILAEVTFPDVDDSTVDINHTYVSDTLRGQGIAGKLMEAVVNQLQSQNKKAVLSCSYAQAWFEKHPQYNYLIK